MEFPRATPKPGELTGGYFIIRDAMPANLPGVCDKCLQQEARFSIGNYYLCVDCLVEEAKAGQIEKGSTLFRVPPLTLPIP